MSISEYPPLQTLQACLKRLTLHFFLINTIKKMYNSTNNQPYIIIKRMANTKAQFNPRHLKYNSLNILMRGITSEKNIHYNDVTTAVYMSNTTYHRLLEGEDMRLNYYLRFFHVLSSYCQNEEEFREYVMEFMKQALSEVCRMIGAEEENWGRR